MVLSWMAEEYIKKYSERLNWKPHTKLAEELGCSVSEVEHFREWHKLLKENKWLPQEEEYLKKNYATTCMRKLRNKLHRSKEAIGIKAYQLGLKKSIFYTPQDDKFIIEYWDKMSNAEIGEKLNRTAMAIGHRARKLKLPNKKKSSSIYKVKRAIEENPKITNKEIAVKTGLTIGTVGNYRRELYGYSGQIGIGKKYTKTEDEFLIKNYPKMLIPELHKSMPWRTIQGIRNRCFNLGLRRDKHYKQIIHSNEENEMYKQIKKLNKRGKD